jgi:UDP-N-acetylmuramoyl-tripeptide--D-alanyl-D-alanine ligase
LTPIPLARLASIMGAHAFQIEDRSVTGFATDSKQVTPGDLFIAIKGERVDGHEFAAEAFSRGASAALVEQPVEGPYLQVESVVAALARFGSHERARFTGPVIGVTGSAGKTTTKEFIAAAVSPLGPVLKSEGNRNTEYTSPLLWADLTTETQTVIVEMAMRGFGQIEHLAQIAQPTVGIVTNIGYAHVLQVGSREGIASAKGELLEALPADGTAVLWAEDEYLGHLLNLNLGGRAVTFGFSDQADCRVTHHKPLSWTRSEVNGMIGDKTWTAVLPAVGPHIALDAACAVLTAWVLEVDPQEAAACLEPVVLPPMRMEVRTWHGATLLLDTYNASPPSMISALDTLHQMPVEGRKFVLLGEMRELGSLSEKAHREVGRFTKGLNLDRIGLVGAEMRFVGEEVGSDRTERLATPEQQRTFLAQVKPGDAILIKGSRALELERLLEEPALL